MGYSREYLKGMWLRFYHGIRGFGLHVEFENRTDRHLDIGTSLQPLVDVCQHLHHLQADGLLGRSNLLQDRRQKLQDVGLQLLVRVRTPQSQEHALQQF